MILSKIFKNTLLILAACLVLTACATKKEVVTKETAPEPTPEVTPKTEVIKKIPGQMQGDT